MSQHIPRGLRSWQDREVIANTPEPRQTTVTSAQTETPAQPSSSMQDAADKLTAALNGDISTVTLPTKYFRAYTTIIIGALVGQPNQVFTQKTPNRKAVITTPASNTGTVYIGDSKVNQTQYGFPLPPNSTSPYITVDDLSKIYYLDTTSGDMFTVAWEWGLGHLTVG